MSRQIMASVARGDSPCCEFRVCADQPIRDRGLADYVVPLQGSLLVRDGEGKVEDTVGRLRAHLVLADRAQNEGAPLAGIFNRHGHELSQLSRALYDRRTAEFKPCVQAVFQNEICRPNLLFVEQIEVLAEYRRQRLGLVAVGRMIDLFSGGCGLVALKNEPLRPTASEDPDESRWLDRMRYNLFDSDKPLARIRLTHHWARLGFLPLSGTPYVALAPELRRPTLEEVLQDA